MYVMAGVDLMQCLSEDYQVVLWLDHPKSGGNISHQVPLTIKDVNKQHFQTRDLLGKCHTDTIFFCQLRNLETLNPSVFF